VDGSAAGWRLGGGVPVRRLPVHLAAAKKPGGVKAAIIAPASPLGSSLLLPYVLPACRSLCHRSLQRGVLRIRRCGDITGSMRGDGGAISGCASLEWLKAEGCHGWRGG